MKIEAVKFKRRPIIISEFEGMVYKITEKTSTIGKIPLLYGKVIVKLTNDETLYLDVDLKRINKKLEEKGINKIEKGDIIKFKASIYEKKSKDKDKEITFINRSITNIENVEIIERAPKNINQEMIVNDLTNLKE